MQYRVDPMNLETSISDLGNRWLPVYPQHIAWLFQRGLALIYLAAFGSMAVQIEGLAGADGILPARDFINEQGAVLGASKYWNIPTLFWLDASDTALLAVCYGGMAAALLLFLDRWAIPAALACFTAYLSIVGVGQIFTSYQWDALLLETGFLALFLPGRSRWTIFLFRLLIARFMLMSGVVKLASGDPAWAHLTALDSHYETQPLPSPLGYYAHFLPHGFHAACVFAVLAIELVIPFFVFLAGPFRRFAAYSFLILQASIMLTGNFAFFNLTTVLLCLFLFEDGDLAKILPSRCLAFFPDTPKEASFLASRLSGAWAGIVILTLVCHTWVGMARTYPPQPFLGLIRLTSAFSLVNAYGPFAIVTTRRHEVILEGSSDGETWREYGFQYKPDAPDKPLRWNIPHQPRLDWQLWFLALREPFTPLPWFENFVRKLKSGSPEVLDLLGHDPFPGRPPRFVRVGFYLYRFVPPAERTRTGQLWHRERLSTLER
jgi:hypothetical protein